MDLNQEQINSFSAQTGYQVGKEMIRQINIKEYRVFNYFPDFTMFYASYCTKNKVRLRTRAPQSIENCICFFFRNIVNEQGIDHKRTAIPQEKAVVRISSPNQSFESHFEKGQFRRIFTIFINADYLKSFLAEDAQQFQFLFKQDKTFLLEELISDDIMRTLNAIVKKEAPKNLNDYYYKLKAMELLYHLFQSLGKRKRTTHQTLRAADIKSIYSVRDKLVASLDTPTPIAELKEIAGMNELKMRKIFTQVFGRGIFAYFQYFRMKEAARLLREEKLSVSETGYQMGFENLSHFSREFKRYIGKLPKQYSKDLT